MTFDLEQGVVVLFVVFSRVGAAMMTMPGFSTERFPTRIRLAVAGGVSCALAPVLWSQISDVVRSLAILDIAYILIAETLIGIAIGLSARMLFLALEGMAASVAMSIGLSNVLGVAINESEPLPTLATFIVLGAVALLFALDLHWELLRGLRQSYDVIGVRHAIDAENLLRELVRSVEEGFMAMLRLCSPFLLLAFVLNVSFGLVNRLSPQIPVFFLSAPFLISVGVYWIYLLIPDFFGSFVASVSESIRR